MFSSILVICTGNICRSPYAEFKLKELLPELKISSAGVETVRSNLQDKPADHTAIKIAKEFGVDISNHKAKQVTQELVDDFELILAMELDQIEKLSELIPTVRHKTFLLGHWIGISHIKDPYQQNKGEFRKVFTLINSSAESWQRKLIKNNFV